MITLTTADQALKSFYLDAVTDALDKTSNPLLAQIKKSTADVWGKDVRKLIRYGVKGVVAAGETDEIAAADSNYVQFVAPLKNLYGTIEISDKAIRASQNNEGAFVNLLNGEMDNMVKSASLQFGRMLFGDGSGKVAAIVSADSAEIVTVDEVKNIFEGMSLHAFSDIGAYVGEYIVKNVDRESKQLRVAGLSMGANFLTAGGYFSTQKTKNQELTGLAAIFNTAGETLYGVDRQRKSFMTPYVKAEVGEIDEETIQLAIDKIEENSGGKVNFIVCSWGVRRALAAYYRAHNVVLSTQEIEGGYKAMTFNGIPVVADRFCPNGTMYLLNTDDFCIHQLCDWQWLEGDDGKVLSKLPSKPVYSATLVKYAELMCYKPNGQGMLSGITEK